MKRVVAALVGTALLFGAVVLAVAGVGTGDASPLVVAVTVVLAVIAFVGVLVKVAGGSGVGRAPWDDDGALVADAPERSPAERDLSGEELAEVVEAAGETSRDDGTVAAGVEVVRPVLREALLSALVQGGDDRSAAERSLARGDWTDDATAAAVLDEAVDHPGRSLRRRFEAWLFPERVVRSEGRLAMRAVASTADDVLPTVPGQRAPRTVPVVRPTLEDLRRGADGHLQRAADPLDARSGSAVDGAVAVRDAESVEGGEDESGAEGDASIRGESDADAEDGASESSTGFENPSSLTEENRSGEASGR